MKADKLRRLWSGERRSFVRYALVATVVFVVVVGFLINNSIVEWVRAGIELKHQQRQIEVYQGQIDAVDEQIRLLNSNPDTVEKFAREKFNFARKGDDVYVDRD